MSTKENVVSFVRETMARMKGEDSKAIAERNWRKAKSALKTEIALLEGALVEAEEAVEEKQEALDAAKYPSDKISNGKSYIESIHDASKELYQAQEELEDIENTITFNKDLLENIEK